MSWRDTEPAVTYEKAWDATEEVRQVKLTQEYVDGSHKEIKVPIDDGSKGVEYLIVVVVSEFDDAAADLDYEDEELFVNFGRVLKGNTQFLWQNVIDGLTAAQKTTARFARAKKELIELIVGKNQRNVVSSWLEHKCTKPSGVGPLAHLARMQELIRLTNAFEGTVAKIDANGAKEILFASYPRKWRSEYLKSSRELEDDSMLGIAQYMNRLWNMEELSGRGRSSHNKKNRYYSRRDSSSDSDVDDIDDDGDKRSRNNKKDNKSTNRNKKRSRDSDDGYQSNNKRFRRPQGSDDCPIHGGGHKWEDCYDNPYGPNYKPRRRRNNNTNERRDNNGNGGQGYEQRHPRNNTNNNTNDKNNHHYYNDEVSNNQSETPNQNEVRDKNDQHHFDLIGNALTY